MRACYRARKYFPANGTPALDKRARTVSRMSYPLPPGWPRSRLEVIASTIVFCVGLVIIIGIRTLTGPSSNPQTDTKPPQMASQSGMGVTARDEEACMRLSVDWAEFRASGSPRWGAGVDMSRLTPTVRDAFAAGKDMSAARQRVSAGTGTPDELRIATDEAVAQTTAGCGFDPQLFDSIDRR